MRRAYCEENFLIEPNFFVLKDFMEHFFKMKNDQSDFLKLFWGTAAFSIFFLVCCTAVFIFLPLENEVKKEEVKEVVLETPVEPEVPVKELFADFEFNSKITEMQNKTDDGLALYRQMESKAAVEWFYTHVTNSREIAIAVLEEAEKNNIPLSLAFSLAHTESNYKATAVHKNTNGSIDRGLFQLNNNSFPNVAEADFFIPSVSAKYGLSHLRFCLNSAGNEIAALAMYNAGTNKVRNGNTPQVTLNYISKIEEYRSFLEDTFATEVVAFYSVRESTDKLLAKK